MSESERLYTRRRMLTMLGGLGALAVAGGDAVGQEAFRMFTPPMDMGAFYPLLKPLDEDADLTAVKGQSGRAAGQVVHVAGRVLNARGEPVAGARIEIWQANTHGRYVHPSDPNNAPLDPNFQGSAVLTTDAEGRYRFKTIKPGSYPISPTDRRTPHIHFEVTGRTNRLSTQMFFPDEPLNAKDGILQSVPFEKSGLIARRLPPVEGVAPEELALGWDIVLING